MKKFLLISILFLAFGLVFGGVAGGQETPPVAPDEVSETAAPTSSPVGETPPKPPEGETPPKPPGGDDAEKPNPKVEGTQSWWQSLLSDLLSLFAVIFVPVLSALGFWLLRKMGIKVDLEKLDSLALSAASYAEHKAKVALKEGAAKSPGAQKETWAWEFVDAIDKKLKGSAKAREKLRALILSNIPSAEMDSKPLEPPKVG